MKYQTVQIRNREAGISHGKLKENRASGETPAVLSRSGSEALSLAVPTEELKKAVRKSGVGGIMELVEEGGAKHLGLLKELQWHPVTQKIQHASFQEVRRDQIVNTTVHLVFTGEPKAAAEKTGQFIKNNEQIELHAKVSNLPDHITVDIGNMEVGDVITCGDLQLPEGCEALHPDAVICSLTTPTVIVLETPTAETDVVGEVAATEEETTPAAEGQ